MKAKKQLIPSKETEPQDGEPPATSAMPLPPNTSTPASNRNAQVASQNRKFAWQVASNLIVSFKYAWAGVSYAFQTQRNFRIHVAIGAIALGLSIFLHLKPVEMAVIGLTCGLVLVMELLNTAIESVVDLTVKQSYHELAKIAKDCAAGAVLVSALAAILVAGSLLLPPLLTVIQDLVIGH